MTHGFQEIDGECCWVMTFSASEMELLKKYHAVIGRLTKIEFRGIV